MANDATPKFSVGDTVEWNQRARNDPRQTPRIARLGDRVFTILEIIAVAEKYSPNMVAVVGHTQMIVIDTDHGRRQVSGALFMHATETAAAE